MSGYPRVYDSSPSSAASSSGLMVFGLVLGALLLVPLLVICGNSSSGDGEGLFTDTQAEQAVDSAFASGDSARLGPITVGGLTTASASDPTALDAEAAPAGQIYVVQPGDSLWAIANQFGVSVEAVQEANGITDPAVLSVGQELTIPAAPADAGGG